MKKYELKKKKYITDFQWIVSDSLKSIYFWGDGSVGRILSEQRWGPEFGVPEPKKEQMEQWTSVTLGLLLLGLRWKHEKSRKPSGYLIWFMKEQNDPA